MIIRRLREQIRNGELPCSSVGFQRLRVRGMHHYLLLDRRETLLLIFLRKRVIFRNSENDTLDGLEWRNDQEEANPKAHLGFLAAHIRRVSLQRLCSGVSREQTGFVSSKVWLRHCD